MDLLKRLGKQTDLMAAAAVVLVVVMLVIPLPPFLLDLAITLNISVALAIVVARPPGSPVSISSIIRPNGYKSARRSS